MKLTVKNFGPIRQAKNIEVKPMTIFVGPGNTGKSYLAMLIYATNRVLLSAWRLHMSLSFDARTDFLERVGSFFWDFGKSRSHDCDVDKAFSQGYDADLEQGMAQRGAEMLWGGCQKPC